MKEFEQLDLYNLPSDILKGDYEFHIRLHGITEWLVMEQYTDRLKILKDFIEVELLEYRYCKNKQHEL